MFTVFIIGLICAIIGSIVAKNKGRSAVGWFLLCGFLCPLLLVLLALPPLHSKTGERKCPFCAEWIKSEAKVCKHCGRGTSMTSSTE